VAKSGPIVIRIPRPYETEEEFIRGDGLAIGRLGMILIGAPKRPPGITTRFEVVLSGGEPVFRGEGRVVAHRIHANGREGLEIRFTRLDSRSKALVEQVLELRRTGALTPVSVSKPPPSAERQEPESAAPSSPEHTSSPPDELGEAAVADQPSDAEAASEEAPEEAPEEVPESQTAAGKDDANAQEVLDSSELAPVEEESHDEEGRSEQATLAASEEEPSVEDRPDEASEPPEPPAEDSSDPLVAEASEPPAAASTVEPDEEIEEVEEIVPEPVDEDPTPFAPPVVFDAEPDVPHPALEPEPAPAEAPADVAAEPDAPEPAPEPAPAETTADVAPVDAPAGLAKLRDRAAAFEPLESADALLDRLRQRTKAL